MRTLLVIAAALASGCFSPAFDTCAIECGAGGACPDGLSCLQDGICHRSASEALCSPRPDADPNRPDADPNQPDADPNKPDAGPPVTPDAPGQLVISEIMVDPGRTPEEPHEWFEVHNPSDSVTYDLMGMTIEDDTGFESMRFDVDVSLLVPPGGRVVFGRNDDAGSNGGVAVDFDYVDTFALGNSGDAILIINPLSDVVIDEVVYDALWDAEGAALSLDPDEHSATANDLEASWCDATTPFGDELPLDMGTPGAANPDC